MSDEQLHEPSQPEHDPWEQVPQRTHRPWWFWLATGFGGLVLFLSACFLAISATAETLYYVAPDSEYGITTRETPPATVPRM